MRLSQVLVVAAASFLFASETIAVTMDSNQAKISTVEGGGPSQRLLRRYEEPDSDDLDDLDDTEERGRTIYDLAAKWGHSVDDIQNGVVKLSESRYEKWRTALNEAIEAKKRAKREAANAAEARQAATSSNSTIYAQERDASTGAAINEKVTVDSKVFCNHYQALKTFPDGSMGTTSTSVQVVRFFRC
ncbi:Avr1b-1 Avirulence-like protein [Phytophthora palmivora]|uniref:RxLR effector protein n=1 Tax=Phytophthora palmivora TaxID=4796 RepID=A0A2P4XF72_9STRA|nr:Avr1b-1 Avirulence-like protein [Phytophthora palmivora]